MASSRSLYVGFTRDGRKEGLGILKTKDYVYEGMFVNGEFQGIGMLKTSDYEYIGEFEAGKPCGIGRKEDFDSGSTFIGVFEESQPSGIGERIEGMLVERGEFKNGRLDGLGVVEWKGKERSRGRFQDGLRHGWCFEQSEGVKFEGQFEKDKREGFGELIKKEFRYKGMWRDG